MTLLFIFHCLMMTAQDVSEFGKVDPELLRKPGSLITKGAEAEVIFDVSEISFSVVNGDPEIFIKAHTRIKIYNQNGLDEANVSLSYIPRQGAEVISKLEAQTYNLDASGNLVVSKLDKKSIYDKRSDNMFSKLTFTMPEAKAGSVIEYRYTLRRKLIYFDDWYFQRDIPVIYSQCQFEYPNAFTFNMIPHNNLPIESTKKETGYTIKHNFVMRNLQSVRPEPFMTATSDYKQKLKFDVIGYNPPGGFARDLRSNWPGIVKALMEDEDFGKQLTKNIPRTTDLDMALQKTTQPYARMAIVHDYVRKNMAWDGTTSKWALDGVKKAWEKKRGNSGEINLILVNLLKDAGLKASPVLVSTKENGRVKPMDPGYSQFNTVMAYVVIDSSFYVLDATDKYTPANLIPPSVIYTEGLVISKLNLERSITDQDWGWRTLWNESQIFQKLVNVTAAFNGQGMIIGDAFLMHKDYAREKWMETVEPEAEKTTTYFTKANEKLKLKDLAIKNEKNDSLPLEHLFKFELPVEENGGYSTVNINMFTGLESNPFLEEQRYSDVFFGYPQKFTMRGSLSIPEGFVFEEAPKNIKMVMPDNSIEMKRIFQVEGSMIKYVVEINIKKPFYAPDEYEELREFYKKMYSLLNEQVVIRKK